MTMLVALLAQAIQDAPPRSGLWPVFIQWLVPLIPVAAFYILLAVCLWRAAKYFNNAAKEQKLLRIEMGKLAEEVHLLRQELGSGKKGESSTESG